MGKYCPACDKCAFKANAPSGAVRVATVIVPRAEYACVQAGGAEIVQTEDGVIGALRPRGFFPITDAGAEFHRRQGSPLAAYV